MSRKHIELIHSDDWSVLKINGEVIYENHSIDGDDVLEILGHHLNEHIDTTVIYED